MTIVSPPSLSRRDGWVAVTWRLSGQGPLAGRELFFSVPEDFAHLLSDRSDAALLGLLIPAMERGVDLRFRGVVSPRLLAALRGPLQEMILPVMPRLRTIRIEADDAAAAPAPSAGARITGFSAGVDSLYTLLRPRQPGDAPPDLLFNANVGAHGEGDAADGVFRRRIAQLGPAAREFGLPLVAVDSNLRRFHGRASDFLSTFVVRNASAILAIQAGAASFESSSSYSRAYRDLDLAGDLTGIEHRIPPLLATESLAMRTTGVESTRVEKMLLVTDRPESARVLDVCQEPRRAGGRTNCSRCRKCQWALIFLDIAGRLEAYRDRFDLPLYRRLRWWAHAYYLHCPPEWRRDLDAFAAERGYAFSPLGRAMSKPGLFQVGKLAQRLLARLP